MGGKIDELGAGVAGAVGHAVEGVAALFEQIEIGGGLQLGLGGSIGPAHLIGTAPAVPLAHAEAHAGEVASAHDRDIATTGGGQFAGGALRLGASPSVGLVCLLLGCNQGAHVNEPGTLPAGTAGAILGQACGLGGLLFGDACGLAIFAQLLES